MEIKILTDLCRICLSDNVLLSVFDTTNNEQISEKIMACASVDVAYGDQLPSQICKQCYRALEISYLFKTKCEQMDRQLRQIIEDQTMLVNRSNKHSPMKIEINRASARSPFFKDLDTFNFVSKTIETDPTFITNATENNKRKRKDLLCNSEVPNIKSTESVNSVYTVSNISDDLTVVNTSQLNTENNVSKNKININSEERVSNEQHLPEVSFQEQPFLEQTSTSISPTNSGMMYLENNDFHFGEECEVTTNEIIPSETQIINHIAPECLVPLSTQDSRLPKGKFVVIKSIIKPQNIHYVNINDIRPKQDDSQLACEIKNEPISDVEHIKAEIPEPASFVETETVAQTFFLDEENIEEFVEETHTIEEFVGDDQTFEEVVEDSVNTEELVENSQRLVHKNHSSSLLLQNDFEDDTLLNESITSSGVTEVQTVEVIEEQIRPYDLNLRDEDRSSASKYKPAKKRTMKHRGRPRKVAKNVPPQGVSYLKSGRKNAPQLFIRPRKRSSRYLNEEGGGIKIKADGTNIYTKTLPVIKRARVERIIPPKKFDDKKPEPYRKLSTNLILSDKQFNKLNDPQKQVLYQRLKLQSVRPTSKRDISERGIPKPIYNVPPARLSDDSSDDDSVENSKIKRKHTKKNSISDDLAIIQSTNNNKSSKIKLKNLQTIDQDLKLINGSYNNKETVSTAASQNKASEIKNSESKESTPIIAKTGRHTAIKSKRPQKRNHLNMDNSSDPQKVEIELKMVPRKSERQRSPKKIFPEIDIFASPKRKVIEIPISENYDSPKSDKEKKYDYQVTHNGKFKVKFRNRRTDSSNTIDSTHVKEENTDFKISDNIVNECYNEIEVETENDDPSNDQSSSDESFSSKDNLKVVMDILKKDRVKLDYGAGLTCNVCNKSFPYRSHLIRHVQTHTGLKPYSCEYCKKNFTSLSSLNIHTKNHVGDLPYKCEVCGRGFVQPSVLKRHMLSHTGEHPFQCDICLKTFVHDSSLKTHLKMHAITEPQHKCDICEKKFKYLSTLTSHIKTHSGIKPFTCPECRKAFYRRSLLTRHLRCHTKERPYKCKLCKARFAYSGGLASHKKLHTGIRPYECEMCDFTFFRRSHLKNHMQKIHNNGVLLTCHRCHLSFDSKPLFRRHLSIHIQKDEPVEVDTGIIGEEEDDEEEY